MHLNWEQNKNILRWLKKTTTDFGYLPRLIFLLSAFKCAGSSFQSEMYMNNLDDGIDNAKLAHHENDWIFSQNLILIDWKTGGFVALKH